MNRILKQISRCTMTALVICSMAVCGRETVNAAKKTAASGVQAVKQEVTENAQATYEELYKGLIRDFRKVIKKGITNKTEIFGDPSVIYEIPYFQDKKYLGYAITDLSGDGIPELVIGGIEAYGEDGGYGDQVYVVYSCIGDQLVMPLDGAYRQSYRYVGNGSFFYQGSASAFSQIFGHFTLRPDASGLKCKQYYFSDEKKGASGVIGYYCNTSGKLDAEGSKELTKKQFFKRSRKMAKKTEQLAFTPFVS